MDEQERVAAFLREYDLEADPAYRVLDLAAETGEIAADAAKSAEYGADPDSLAVSEDELGDALFSLLAVAAAVDVDAGAALERSLAKYDRRTSETGDPRSGSGGKNENENGNESGEGNGREHGSGDTNGSSGPDGEGA
jgi:NTP pyrophosphatase (non-canonical NTP hydrolase)